MKNIYFCCAASLILCSEPLTSCILSFILPWCENPEWNPLIGYLQLISLLTSAVEMDHLLASKHDATDCLPFN